MAISPSLLAILLLFTFLLQENYADYNSPLFESLQHRVDEWISQKPAGAVAVAITSAAGTEYFFGGELSETNPSHPNEHTVFEIGSITKGFTGLLLADQILSGKVFLHDTLIKLLTDWPGRFHAPAGNVTLLELATHSSGLPKIPDNLNSTSSPENPYVNYTKEDLYQWLDKEELVNRGSFRYSNAGAGILGHALEVNGKKKYEDFLRERVFDPLGLLDTTITLDADQKRRLAPGYAANGDHASNWYFDVLAPGGSIRSTVAELGHFLRLATGVEKIQKTIGEALEFSIKPRGNTTLEFTTVGLFWMQKSLLPEDKLLEWHDGGTGGYNSYIAWVPDRQVGIVVLASIAENENNTNDADELALDMLKMKLGD